MHGRWWHGWFVFYPSEQRALIRRLQLMALRNSCDTPAAIADHYRTIATAQRASKGLV